MGTLVNAMNEINPASVLARLKWNGMTKAQRKEHMKKMTESATKARKEKAALKLSTKNLAQGKI